VLTVNLNPKKAPAVNRWWRREPAATVLQPMTRITHKSVTDVTTLSIAAPKTLGRMDDIYPANPGDPDGWPKWRRILTMTRDGSVFVVYTHHEEKNDGAA